MYDYLMNFFLDSSLNDDNLEMFIGATLDAVKEEVNKLEDGQVFLCSTEVLESMFGKYKEINQGRQGVTGNVLGIPLLAGNSPMEEETIESMETCSVKKAMAWPNFTSVVPECQLSA